MALRRLMATRGSCTVRPFNLKSSARLKNEKGEVLANLVKLSVGTVVVVLLLRLVESNSVGTVAVVLLLKLVEGDSVGTVAVESDWVGTVAVVLLLKLVESNLVGTVTVVAVECHQLGIDPAGHVLMCCGLRAPAGQ